MQRPALLPVTEADTLCDQSEDGSRVQMCGGQDRAFDYVSHGVSLHYYDGVVVWKHICWSICTVYILSFFTAATNAPVRTRVMKSVSNIKTF